jgi:hypothetical protein
LAKSIIERSETIQQNTIKVVVAKAACNRSLRKHKNNMNATFILLTINPVWGIAVMAFWYLVYVGYKKMGKGVTNLMAKHLNGMNFKKESTLLPKQVWAITTSADISICNCQFLNALETGLGKEGVKKLLSEWWGIDTREDFLTIADNLWKEGKRGIYNEVLRAQYFSIIKKDKSLWLAVKEKYNDERAEFVEKIKNNCVELVCLLRGYAVPFPYPELKKINCEDQDFTAWDLCRLVNITRYAFEAEFISEAEAWDIIMKAAKEIQKKYKSWEEMSEVYDFGKYVWNPDAYKADFADDVKGNLLLHAESPFKNLDWQLNLN